MPQPPPDTLVADRTPDDMARMFDQIAGRYDLLNRLLSGGRDRVWRARAVESLQLQGGETVLDLCTGTADLLLALAAPRGPAARVVGIDFSAEMLRLASRQNHGSPGGGAAGLLRGGAGRIPPP
ncbi:MAG: class I SAM-dependent methyltransferase, partial [Acidobacteria bacterium]|nr:class I SAM-dependent methyltransferase [Acidobacteriota bacterium]